MADQGEPSFCKTSIFAITHGRPYASADPPKTDHPAGGP